MIQPETQKTSKCCKTQQNGILIKKRDFLKKRASKTIVFVVNPPMQKQKNLGLVGGGVPAPFKIA
jgi:hypothetical protein